MLGYANGSVKVHLHGGTVNRKTCLVRRRTLTSSDAQCDTRHRFFHGVLNSTHRGHDGRLVSHVHGHDDVHVRVRQSTLHRLELGPISARQDKPCTSSGELVRDDVP